MGVVRLIALRRPCAVVAGVVLAAALAPGLQPPPAAPAAAPPDPFKPADPTAIEVVRWLDARAAEQRFPFPYDAARATAVRAAALAWCRKTTVEVFEKTGTTAPWAAQAKAALELRAKAMAGADVSGFTDVLANKAAAEALRAAVAAGCDDPYVRYSSVQARRTAWELYGEEYDHELLRAAAALYASPYPDVRKLHAAHNAYVGLKARWADLTAAEKKETKVWDTRFWELFDRCCADPDPFVQGDIADIVSLRLGGGHSTYEDVANRLERAKAAAYTRQLVKGQYLIGHAWAARGSGVAATVTEQGWRDFRDRLEGARAAFTAAWESDKTRPEAPTEMLTVCKGLQADRPELELWFARAVAANPDNTRACALKLDYLLPKWHGSMEEYLGFGWQCVRTRNTAGYVTWAPVVGHVREAPVLGPAGESDPDGLRKYYGHVAVWQQIETACRLQLADRPDDVYTRSMYARLATIAGRYEVAGREFDTLGDAYWPGVFASKKEYTTNRKWAKDKTPPAPAP